MGTIGHILSTFKYSVDIPYEMKALKGLMLTLSKDDLMFLRKYFLTYICKGKEYDQHGETLESFLMRRHVLNLLKDVIDILHPDTHKKEENKSIGYLLKLFSTRINNDSVKKELMARYDFQTSNIQRKIISAFINADDKDARWWACWRLLENWNNCFSNDIKRLWELYREEPCGRLVIQYLPKQYVIENQNILGVGRNYMYLGLRLFDTPNFVIDKDKFNKSNCLNEYNYLYVIAKTGGLIEGEKMLHSLFKLITEEITSNSHNYNAICNNMDCYSEDGMYASSKLIPDVCMLIECMGEMGLSKELIYYLNWDREIQEKFQISWHEYMTITDEKNSTVTAWNFFCKIAKENFPIDFMYLLKEEQAENLKQPSVYELSKKNPKLMRLVENFELE